MQRRVLVAICGMLALASRSIAADIGVTPKKLIVVDKLAEGDES